jgi:cbb3-type cytochrome oxidase maturation protein
MDNSVLYGLLIALCMGFGALAIFFWAVFSDQMEDTEDIKYRILERELTDEGK